MLLAYGIMLALWQRAKTGVGQKVESSLLHTYLALQMGQLMVAEEDPSPSRPIDATSSLYECSDGEFIHVTAHTDEQFIRLCRLLEVEHILEDPRAPRSCPKTRASRRGVPDRRGDNPNGASCGLAHTARSSRHTFWACSQAAAGVYGAASGGQLHVRGA